MTIAAPPIRPSAAAPEDQPDSKSDFAKVPEKPKAAAEAKASPRPDNAVREVVFMVISNIPSFDPAARRILQIS
ncbi:hypothetical protein GCM10009569_12180 [Arthrobacter russicus]